MIIPAHIRIAVASLRSTRFRTTLTTLGIVIGVMSITMVMALGEGVKTTINQQTGKLGDQIVLVRPGIQSFGGVNSVNPYSLPLASSLTERDMASVSRLKQVRLAAPIMLIGGSIHGQSGRKTSPIVATSQDLADILQLKITSGQFLDPSTTSSTVVLGQSLAVGILGTDRALGQSITLKGQSHTVIGILKKSDTSLNVAGIDIDNSAFVIFDDGKALNQGMGQIQQILAAASSDSSAAQAQTAISAAITNNHNGEQDYSVLTGNQISTTTNSQYNTVVGVTMAVAAISLVVGGVGIMNVMLVSVTERTREIGIRKALGATNQQILLQFLIEASLITLVGTLIGLGLAFVLSYVAAGFMGFSPNFSWQGAGFSALVAFSVGLFFGLFPALRAAHRNPIQALRHYN